MEKKRRPIVLPVRYDDSMSVDDMMKEKHVKLKAGEYRNKEVSNWGAKDFVTYFCDQVREIYGKGPFATNKDSLMAGNLVRKMEKEDLKFFIDTYLSNPETFPTQTFTNFISNYTQDRLWRFYRTGNFR